MKKLLTVLLLVAGSHSFAQQVSSGGGCATVPNQQTLERIYDFVQHNPAAYAAKGTAVVDTIPLSVHIVGDDNGGGYYQLTDLFKVICQLNQRFSPVGFYYYVKWPIHYINNSDYYDHNYFSGDQMMNTYNVPDAVNVYFVNDPAGACGYYTHNQDAVAIKKSCSGNNSTTLTHELGHFFSLPHTFNGWEGGNPPSNPELVRRSGPGANCNSTGDFFCDTDADYISDRWSCPRTIARTDLLGDAYHVDSSLYMSYSMDACQSRFSNQQINAMQYDLHNFRPDIYNRPVPAHSPMALSTVVYPNDTMYSNLQKITWKKMPGAEYYYVRVSFTLLPSLNKQVTFTADTSLTINFPLIENADYLITIAPVNAFDFCQSKVLTDTFVYSSATGPVNVGLVNNEEKGIRLFPNPLTSGNGLDIRFAGLPADKYQVQITNMAGAVVYQTNVKTAGGIETMKLAIPSLTNGVYFVRCSSAQLQHSQKLVIAY